MWQSHPLTVSELQELKDHGFVIRRGAFSDIASEVMNITGEKFEAILKSGIDFKQVMLEAGKLDPVANQTGASGVITVSDHFKSPLLAGWTMEDTGPQSQDIRMDESAYPQERDSAIGELIRRVHSVLSPFGEDLRSYLQVRWMPPFTGKRLSSDEILRSLGIHSDGAGRFHRLANLKELPSFRFLIGAYLTDMDSEFLEHPCGQLVVLDGGHRLVTRLYAELIPELEHIASAKARVDLFKSRLTGAVREYCFAHPDELVTVRARPGDLMIAHGLIPHAPNETYFTDPSNRPAGRTAIYFRVGDFAPELMGAEALTNSELAWTLS